MEGLLTAVKSFMVDLKSEIREDDERFEQAMRQAKENDILAKMHVHQKDVIKFSQERAKQAAVEE